MAASLDWRSTSEVLTLRTLGADVSFSTKAWKVLRSGATHLSTKSISPESIQHSRTSGCARTQSSKAERSASAWLARCTMAFPELKAPNFVATRHARHDLLYPVFGNARTRRRQG